MEDFQSSPPQENEASLEVNVSAAMALHPLVMDVLSLACHSRAEVLKDMVHDTPAICKKTQDSKQNYTMDNN